MVRLVAQDKQAQMIVLERHVRVLEARVDTLTEALRVLTRGLEDLPTGEPGDRPAARAARKAHELLLAADSGHDDVAGLDLSG